MELALGLDVVSKEPQGAEANIQGVGDLGVLGPGEVEEAVREGAAAHPFAQKQVAVISGHDPPLPSVEQVHHHLPLRGAVDGMRIGADVQEDVLRILDLREEVQGLALAHVGVYGCPGGDPRLGWYHGYEGFPKALMLGYSRNVVC